MSKTISRTSIRLPEEIDEKLRAFATAHSVTMTEVILTALSHYLDADWGLTVTGRLTDIERRVGALESQTTNHT
jgi:predicted transcriptional regulator